MHALQAAEKNYVRDLRDPEPEREPAKPVMSNTKAKRTLKALTKEAAEVGVPSQKISRIMKSQEELSKKIEQLVGLIEEARRMATTI